MKRPKIRERIRSIAFELLGLHPEGLRYSDLLRKIKQADKELNPNTVNNSIWNLEVVEPTRIYKPVKGLFRLIEFKESVPAELCCRRPKTEPLLEVVPTQN